MLAIGLFDVNKNGLTLQNTLLIMAGTLATGLGMSLLTSSTIPLFVAGLGLVAGGIIDIMNSGVTLENSLLVLSGIMLSTVSLSIKVIASGMVSLGVTIGLVGLAVAALVGAFLYISTVWDKMSTVEKLITVFTGLAAAVLAAALAIAVFHATWTQGLAVAVIVGSIAALVAAFASVKNDIDKTTMSGGAGSLSSPSGTLVGNGYSPQYQAATYGGSAIAQGQYQEMSQQSAVDSREIIRLLNEIANKDTNLYVDGDRLTQSIYPRIEQRTAQKGTVLVR
jgi:hypothetical protein